MDISAKDLKIFIDPSSPAYYCNELFNENSPLNRDQQSGPFILLKEKLRSRGISVNTADYLLNNKLPGAVNIYSSLGIVDNYRSLNSSGSMYMQSFYIFEPPIVSPHLYREIGHLLTYFQQVYVFNIEGTGYEKCFDSQRNLKKLFYPQARNSPIEYLWTNEDRGFVTMINSNKTASSNIQLKRGQKPLSLEIVLNDFSNVNELYSERIRAVVELHNMCRVDLYGFDWDASLYQVMRKILGNHAFPHMYWKNRKLLKAMYKGQAKSKYETLSRYKFAITFENMALPGYITEKIFDCFFVGTIPIYLGAPDIDKSVPESCFIDMRDFNNYKELYTYISNLSDAEISSFKQAARSYLSSEQYQPFTGERFAQQFEADLKETLQANNINLIDSQFN